MTYIWELAIQAKGRGIDSDTIVYKFDDDFSPYMANLDPQVKKHA